MKKPEKPVEWNYKNWRNWCDYEKAYKEYEMQLQAYYIAIAIRETILTS